MKRRDFLILGSMTLLTNSAEAQEHDTDTKKEFQSLYLTIASVQAHLFPGGSILPSAKSMQMTKFLVDTVSHPTYDKDIRAFIIEGAKELEKREKGNFTKLQEKEREKALRAYEESEYGSSWLFRIMVLSMEALLSDPIYGSNLKEAGWKALETQGGFPRPKTKYIML